MSKQLVQTVYVPTRVEDELPKESCKCGIIKNEKFDLSYFIKNTNYEIFDHVKSGLSHKKSEITHWLKPKKGIFFTVEEYNKHIKEVIEQTLETAAEKADTTWRSVSRGTEEVVDKDSITNTFEETYLKYKI